MHRRNDIRNITLFGTQRNKFPVPTSSNNCVHGHCTLEPLPPSLQRERERNKSKKLTPALGDRERKSRHIEEPKGGRYFPKRCALGVTCLPLSLPLSLSSSLSISDVTGSTSSYLTSLIYIDPYIFLLITTTTHKPRPTFWNNIYSCTIATVPVLCVGDITILHANPDLFSCPYHVQRKY